MASNKKSVLMVCYGNICRSVMAESILKELVADRSDADQWYIDSAATSGHEAGSLPDERTNQTLRKHGRKESDHVARKITSGDYTKFQYIFGFDKENMKNLERMKPSGSTALIKLIGDYDKKKPGIKVEDPWWHGMQSFEDCYDQCDRYCKTFLAEFDSSN